MMAQSNKLYERLQLFSGGGSRFGYYLGSYAALVDNDLTPDIIIGTCGGSLSALLVHLAPDPKQLQQLAYSAELYRVIKAIRHVAAHEANIGLKLRYSTQAIKRWRLSRNTTQRHLRLAETHKQLLDELQQLAMFRVDNEEQWLDELLQFLPKDVLSDARQEGSFKHSAPDIAIIASRLQPAVNSAHHHDSNVAALQAKTAKGSAQLQELLFAPKRLSLNANDNAELALSNTLVAPAHFLANGRIQPAVKTVTEWDFATAVRASMADMYYLPPIEDQDLGWCLGGVINLTPVELACQLATTVFAESKAGYDLWLAAPAIQRVFGFDPNQRLAQVHSFSPSFSPSIHPHFSANHSPNASGQDNSPLHWLPFADNGQQLSGQVQKRFSLQQLTVELIHSDYDGFVEQMQAQWRYGYQRTADYIQQQGL